MISKKIITNDESITYYNEEFDETYHSNSGAKEEAIKKFSEAVKLANLAKNQNKITILDICFGLGYNSAAAIDTIKNANPSCEIEIIGLELDRGILEKITELPDYFDSMSMIKALINDPNLALKKENISLKIKLGNARETIKTISTQVDVVFLDPFSPKKCPILWEKEFFDEIYHLMSKNAKLATYSCARKVRDNLKEAGFEVIDGPCVGRRSPSTIAIKN